jgi:signal peptidase II
LKRRLLYSLALLVLIADQWTKRWVLSAYPTWPSDGGDYSRDLIPGFFSFTYVHNTGGAFGILPEGTQLLALAALIAAVGIIVYTVRARSPLPRLLGFALALPLGGSLGNLLDRVRLHYVVDFLDVHVGVHQWPVFNVADSAICLGVGLLAVYFWSQPAGDKSAATAVQEKGASRPSVPGD